MTVNISSEKHLLIDGRLVAARSGRTFNNVNPATEERLGVAADATAEDMEQAIAAARRAFDRGKWASDPGFRRGCLDQLLAALREERERIRATLIAENGSPTSMGAIQVDDPIDHFMPYDVDLADSYDYETRLPNIERRGARHARIVVREPIGVVAAITPWNAPFYLNLTKAVPALAAGCTVVLKPAPDTPWTGALLGRLIAERTDIPPGVINVVTTADNSVAEQLTRDPRVDAITFTGSTATGRLIMRNAADTVKKVCLELGGKSAAIVLDDADLVTAVAQVARFVCTNGGQGCTIATRLLLPRRHYEAGVEIAARALAEVPYGDPLDPINVQGPQINGRQQSRVLDYIKQGCGQGARLVVGGHAPAHLPKGYFVEPTLLADVDNTNIVAREEIFGPVLAAIPYDDDDDAVRIANDSIYGLSCNVLSNDPERALAIARRIRAGTVSVNGGTWFAADAPFGGYRQSGLGRERGVLGFEEYLEVKTIGLPASSP